MKVSQLVTMLMAMPQDCDVYIHDADESCLLSLNEFSVSLEKGDKNYPFERVEVGSDYENRIPMVPWYT